MFRLHLAVDGLVQSFIASFPPKGSNFSFYLSRSRARSAFIFSLFCQCETPRDEEKREEFKIKISKKKPENLVYIDESPNG